jgi:hypothetical protein
MPGVRESNQREGHPSAGPFGFVRTGDPCARARTLRKAKSQELKAKNQKQNQSERIKPAVRHTPYRRAAPAPSARTDARRSTWGP